MLLSPSQVQGGHLIQRILELENFPGNRFNKQTNHDPPHREGLCWTVEVGAAGLRSSK